MQNKNLQQRRKVMTKPIPDGFHTITPSFTFKNSQEAIDFYKKAFGAKLLSSFKHPDGRGIMHATIQIGDSILMMGDEAPQCQSAESLGGSPITLYIYTPDADKLFDQAIAAGCAETMPMAEMFWGDRAGSIKDPFGYSWMIATHKRDLTDEQIRKGAEAFFAQMAKNNA
jgi:PhnB protein